MTIEASVCSNWETVFEIYLLALALALLSLLPMVSLALALALALDLSLDLDLALALALALALDLVLVLALASQGNHALVARKRVWVSIEGGKAWRGSANALPFIHSFKL